MNEHKKAIKSIKAVVAAPYVPVVDEAELEEWEAAHTEPKPESIVPEEAGASLETSGTELETAGASAENKEASPTVISYKELQEKEFEKTGEKPKKRVLKGDEKTALYQRWWFWFILFAVATAGAFYIGIYQ